MQFEQLANTATVGEPSSRAIPQGSLKIVALFVLAAQMTALLLLWPIPELGLQIDPATGTIVHITPASAAEKAGLRIQDQVITVYSYHPSDIERQLILFPVAWSAHQSVPIQVERAGQRLDLQIVTELPAQAFQVEKLIAFLLGFICWLTGVLIGLVRRHHFAGGSAIAWFWILVGGIVGLYTFAR